MPMGVAILAGFGMQRHANGREDDMEQVFFGKIEITFTHKTKEDVISLTKRVHDLIEGHRGEIKSWDAGYSVYGNDAKSDDSSTKEVMIDE
jgi:hypothetical protein